MDVWRISATCIILCMAAGCASSVRPSVESKPSTTSKPATDEATKEIPIFMDPKSVDPVRGGLLITCKPIKISGKDALTAELRIVNLQEEDVFFDVSEQEFDWTERGNGRFRAIHAAGIIWPPNRSRFALLAAATRENNTWKANGLCAATVKGKLSGSPGKEGSHLFDDVVLKDQDLKLRMYVRGYYRSNGREFMSLIVEIPAVLVK